MAKALADELDGLAGFEHQGGPRVAHDVGSERNAQSKPGAQDMSMAIESP